MELSSVSFYPHLHEPKTQQKKGKIGKEVRNLFYFIIKASLTAPLSRFNYYDRANGYAVNRKLVKI